eukprot:TRINITY_DN67919_c0_g1_i1.p1 TRINITY_DN67919_c0_g1~~TRINITY_DN67919_c0_g1_i1.p1  ORF type:complete len:123 (-),score=18.33 TRINITY_DN67919_c0_g1_i1:50-397(-)
MTHEGGVEPPLFPPSPPKQTVAEVFAGLRTVVSMEDNRNTFAKLVRYSFIMFTLPVIVLLAVRNGVLANYDSNVRDGVAVIAAVVSANLVIAAYVLSAFNDPAERIPSVLEKKDS